MYYSWRCRRGPGAREEILRFHSLLELQDDGGVVVTETITVRAEGRQIKRGIYRDIPYNYVGSLGDRRPAGLKLLDVDSDVTGKAHFTERKGEYLRIYMGERNYFLPTGTYTYTFRYSMDGQVGFFDDYDEIYWNVTGNRWSFPINEVVSRIVIPERGKIGQTAAYTGRRGSTGKDYDVRTVANNVVEFRSTRKFSRGEEITVAAGWPKGIIAEPSTTEKALSWLFGNAGLLALFASAVAVPWYLFSSWLRVGRDPEKGVIIPLFSAPSGLSPAAISYIHYMKLKSAGRGASRALIAALISLAVKGRIRLEEAGDDVTVHLVDNSSADLPLGEAALHRSLFSSADRFTFNQANASRFSRIRKNFQSAIKAEHRGIYFNDNLGHFWIAAVLGIAGVVAFFLFSRPTEDQIGLFVVLGVFAVFAAVFLSAGISQFRKGGFGGYFGPIVAFFMLLNFGSSFVSGASFDFSPSVVLPGLAVLVMVVSAALFGFLLRAPTPLGRRTMDQIEGLKLYMSVAESERMNMRDAPDLSVQQFEKLLPFAIALDVERPWSNAFSDHMAKMVPGQDRNDYQPNWYGGRSWGSRGLGRATEGMVSAVSDSMAAAAPAPSSSGSGSFGGGSSGGGGGGGGGGGW